MRIRVGRGTPMHGTELPGASPHPAVRLGWSTHGREHLPALPTTQSVRRGAYLRLGTSGARRKRSARHVTHQPASAETGSAGAGIEISPSAAPPPGPAPPPAGPEARRSAG